MTTTTTSTKKKELNRIHNEDLNDRGGWLIVLLFASLDSMHARTSIRSVHAHAYQINRQHFQSDFPKMKLLDINCWTTINREHTECRRGDVGEGGCLAKKKKKKRGKANGKKYAPKDKRGKLKRTCSCDKKWIGLHFIELRATVCCAVLWCGVCTHHGVRCWFFFSLSFYLHHLDVFSLCVYGATLYVTFYTRAFHFTGSLHKRIAHLRVRIGKWHM